MDFPGAPHDHVQSLLNAVFHACYLEFLKQKGMSGYKCCSDVVRAAHKVLGLWGQEEIRSGSRAQNCTRLSPWSQMKLRALTNVGSHTSSVGMLLI